MLLDTSICYEYIFSRFVYVGSEQREQRTDTVNISLKKNYFAFPLARHCERCGVYCMMEESVLLFVDYVLWGKKTTRGTKIRVHFELPASNVDSFLNCVQQLCGWHAMAPTPTERASITFLCAIWGNVCICTATSTTRCFTHVLRCLYTYIFIYTNTRHGESIRISFV